MKNRESTLVLCFFSFVMKSIENSKNTKFREQEH